MRNAKTCPVAQLSSKTVLEKTLTCVFTQRVSGFSPLGKSLPLHSAERGASACVLHTSAHLQHSAALNTTATTMVWERPGEPEEEGEWREWRERETESERRGTLLLPPTPTQNTPIPSEKLTNKTRDPLPLPPLHNKRLLKLLLKSVALFL